MLRAMEPALNGARFSAKKGLDIFKMIGLRARYSSSRLAGN